MRCGTKCFYVSVEKEEETVKIPVFARTSAGARKIVRQEYGKNTEISSVKQRDSRTLTN